MIQTITEKILFALSERPDNVQGHGVQEDETLEHALCALQREFLSFLDQVKDKVVLDFGCGRGYQSVALALNGAKSVVGLDINARSLVQARQLAEDCNVKDDLEFTNGLSDEQKGLFDIVISHNSMEHFADPVAILRQMKEALKSDGKILVTFGPPWFAPYGSHMRFFTKVPWVHLLFTEKTVMNVRAEFRSDGAKKYEEVEAGLNKMSVRRFEKVVAESGLRMEQKRYHCIKKMNFLGKIPILRELFVNEISCILVK